jgi:hypothetical protein
MMKMGGGTRKIRKTAGNKILDKARTPRRKPVVPIKIGMIAKDSVTIELNIEPIAYNTSPNKRINSDGQ